MTKWYLPVALLAACLVSSVSGQVVTGPDKVGNGEMIRFFVDANLAAGTDIEWTFLHPRGMGVCTQKTNYGVEYFVDPPINYFGPVEVKCVVIEWDKNKKTSSEWITQVEGKEADPPPDDDDNPPPPDPPDEYDGPNSHNVGKVAWENAPNDPAGKEKVAAAYKEAPSQLTGPNRKAMYWEDPAKNADPNYSVPAWLAAKTPNTPEWIAWADAVNKAINAEERRLGPPLTVGGWWGIYNEIGDALKWQN